MSGAVASSGVGSDGESFTAQIVAPTTATAATGTATQIHRRRLGAVLVTRVGPLTTDGARGTGDAAGPASRIGRSVTGTPSAASRSWSIRPNSAADVGRSSGRLLIAAASTRFNDSGTSGAASSGTGDDAIRTYSATRDSSSAAVKAGLPATSVYIVEASEYTSDAALAARPSRISGAACATDAVM